MGDMWHYVSHTSRAINSAKGIRFGERNQIFCRLTVGERERGKRKKEIQDFFLRSTKFCKSEFIEPRVKVYLLDEGYMYVPKSKEFTETSK